jgi:sec-independent protein translocase protein TatA
MGNLGGWEILIILGVLVLLFGARRLPDMARSIGQSARVFKGEMKGLKDDDKVQQKSPEPSQETVVEKRTETPGSAAQ